MLIPVVVLFGLIGILVAGLVVAMGVIASRQKASRVAVPVRINRPRR